MRLTSIETADCAVEKTFWSQNEVKIHFEKVFDRIARAYINGVILTIKDWSSFAAKLYISDSPFSEVTERMLKDSELEEFDLIQGIDIRENDLILQGYSKNSRHWLEFAFKDCQYQIQFLALDT